MRSVTTEAGVIEILYLKRSNLDLSMDLLSFIQPLQGW